MNALWSRLSSQQFQLRRLRWVEFSTGLLPEFPVCFCKECGTAAFCRWTGFCRAVFKWNRRLAVRCCPSAELLCICLCIDVIVE